MGDVPTTPSNPNPSSTASMDSSNHSQSKSATDPIDRPPQPVESKSADPPSESQAPQTLESQIEESNHGGDGDDAVEEEEGECGFCLFMKGGGCKDAFVEWEKCVEEGEKQEEDIVEKCFQATAALKKCMEAHSDYYAPLLQAEKAAEAEAAKQLEIGEEAPGGSGTKNSSS